MSKLIIISAPSGAGKSTITRFLLKQGLGLQFSISATSRTPRSKEKEGVDYYFLTPDKFRKKIENSEFLEYEEVYKNRFYGTLKSEVKRISDQGSSVLFDIDVIGGLNIKKHYGDQALSIFIQPPSIEILRQRLESRNTDSAETIAERLEKAKLELEYAPKFDVIIVNDNLDKAKSEILVTIKKFLEI